MKKKRVMLVLTWALIAVFLLPGCGGSANNGSGDAAKKDSLVYSIVGEAASMDPVKANDSESQKYHYQIYDGLVREEIDGKLVPALAESWIVSEDNKEITFKIRPNVKFHNGDILTADDVVFSINRSIAAPATKKVTSSMEAAEKIDENTVKLKLKFPFPAAIGCMSSNNMMIVNKKAVEADPEGFARNPVGTGPYMLKEWRSGDRVIFESFADYYRGEAAIKNVTYRIMSDNTTAVLSLENGETDLRDVLQIADVPNVKANQNLKYYEVEMPCYYLISFNNEKGIFSNKKVREAVSYAIDREAVLLGALNGEGEVVEAAMVPTLDAYPKDFKANPYDPEKAKQILAEAGYPNGFTVTFKTAESATYSKPSEIIQQQLKAIGITANIEKMEWAAWQADCIAGGNYEITFWAMPITTSDPDFATYAAFHSTMRNGNGNFVLCNLPEMDALLEKSRITTGDERNEVFRQICELVKEESILIPVYNGRRRVAAHKDLLGVAASPVNKLYCYDYSWAE